MTVYNDLNKRRAEKHSDSKLWTAEQALEDLLADVKSGELKIDRLVVHYHEKKEDGYTCGFTLAGVDRAEHLSVLEIAKFRLLNDWLV